MTDALIGTRKGLFALDGDELDLVGFAGVPVTAVDLRSAATARCTSPSTTATSASRSTAPTTAAETFAEAGPARLPRPACRCDRHRPGARRRRARGRRRWCGRSSRVIPTSPACCGQARSPAACSARPIAAIRGSWSGRCGTIRPEPSGSVAATTTPASTRSRSTRGRPTDVLVGISCGGAWRTTDGGAVVAASRRRGCAPGTCLRRWPTTRRSRTRTGSPPAATSPTWCGASTTAASSARPIAAASWTEITDAGPSTFGFAVAAHPSDPDTAWFVPADERRGADPGRRAHGGHPHPRRRRRASRCSTTDCPTIARTTSCTVTRFDVDEHRRAAPARIDHRRPVGDRRRRRLVPRAVRRPPPSQLRGVRLTELARDSGSRCAYRARRSAAAPHQLQREAFDGGRHRSTSR